MTAEMRFSVPLHDARARWSGCLLPGYDVLHDEWRKLYYCASNALSNMSHLPSPPTLLPTRPPLPRPQPMPPRAAAPAAAAAARRCYLALALLPHYLLWLQQ